MGGDQFLKYLKMKEVTFSDGLMKQKEDLLIEINSINQDLEMLMKKDDLDNYQSISRQYNDLGERIDRAIDEGYLVNLREGILKWQQTDF